MSGGSHADTLQALVDAARKAGAGAADAILVNAASLSVQRRLGKTEQVERSEGFDLGLRVFVGEGTMWTWSRSRSSRNSPPP